MKKFLLALLMSLGISPAYATVPCVIPFNLQNNTIADATQVMANYNALVTCLTNAAASGANSDITSLLGLTTALPYSAGGTNSYTGQGASSGTNNAQVVSSVSPSGFVLQPGTTVTFIPGFTSNGGAAFTLATAGTTAIVVKKAVNGQLVDLSGGDIVANATTRVIYDGTEYILPTPLTGALPPGTLIDYTGSTAPLGFFIADGSCVSQTQFAALFAVLGTSWGTCGAGLFAIPDLRGRVTAAPDNQGGAAAGRLTSPTCNAVSLTVGCGAQTVTLPLSALPNAQLTVSNNASTSVTIAGNAIEAPNASQSPVTISYQPGATTYTSFASNQFTTPIVATSLTSVLTSSINGGVGQTAIPTLQPLLTVLKIVKY